MIGKYLFMKKIYAVKWGKIYAMLKRYTMMCRNQCCILFKRVGTIDVKGDQTNMKARKNVETINVKGDQKYMKERKDDFY